MTDSLYGVPVTITTIDSIDNIPYDTVASTVGTTWTTATITSATNTGNIWYSGAQRGKGAVVSNPDEVVEDGVGHTPISNNLERPEIRLL